MELKILEKIDNPLLKRTKIIAEVLHQGLPTPKRTEIRKLLAAQLGADENLVVVRQLDPTFGSKSKLTRVGGVVSLTALAIGNSNKAKINPIFVSTHQ